MGDYEEEVNSLGNVRKIHYLSGGAMLIQNNGSDSLLYAYSDFHGSLIALTDASGNVVEKYAYDPWGARRNPTDWTQSDTPTSWIVNRGYTGHEHLDRFGIINMNGRVYDSLTAQFFSPDPQLQAPGDWLNYNKYSYAFGNPFKYTDPSGEFVWLIPAIVGIVSGTINLIANWHDGITFGEGLAYFGIGAGAGIGALFAPGYSSLIAAGVGSLNNLTQQSFQPDGSLNFNNINWNQVGYSGVISGATSYLGGQFGKAIGADKWFNGIDNPLIQNVLRNVATNAIVGGTLNGFGALADNDPNTTFGNGVWSGVKMGVVTGTISGIGAAATYSKANNVNFFTGKSNTIKQAGNYTVYRGIDPETGEIKYIGITERDPQIRFNEHKNSNSPRSNLDYYKIEGATNLSKIDARIMEQNYINQYRMIKNGGVLYNQRNSIAPKFWDIYNIKR